MKSYEEFLKKKAVIDKPVGIQKDYPLNPKLFPFQKACVQTALRRGRFGLYEAPGLGKTLQQIEWARVVHEHTNRNILIVAPLAVSNQTVEEGWKFDIPVRRARQKSEVQKGVTVTNYQMLEHFDLNEFIGVVLDESGIIKNESGSMRKMITDRCREMPYRLACSATPAPNDHVELATQAEFLGLMTRSEMLSKYFIHDGGSTQDYYLKGHGEEKFWEWMATWAVCINKPSDIGFDDIGYILPPLQVHTHILDTEPRQNGMLIPVAAQTLGEQRKIKRNTIDARVKACADLVNKTPGHWVMWGELNDECNMLENQCPGTIQVAGADDIDTKEHRLHEFIRQKHRNLTTKASMCGHGLNLQFCHQTAFVNLTHSFEQQYQAIRRFYRFGQTEEVHVHIFLTDCETAILDNVRRKEFEAAKMSENMIGFMRDAMRSEMGMTVRNKTNYEPKQRMEMPAWTGQ